MANAPEFKPVMSQLRETIMIVEEVNEAIQGNEDELCIQEMASFLSGMGYHPTEDELTALYTEMDVDENGRVNKDEFVLFATQRLNESNWREQIMDLFMQLDRDGNGFITTEELKQMFNQIGEKFSEEEIEDLIREADQDGDGQINYKEFIHMMLNTDEDFS